MAKKNGAKKEAKQAAKMSMTAKGKNNPGKKAKRKLKRAY